MKHLANKPTRRPDGAAFFIAVLLAALGALLLWEGARLPQAGGYAGVGPAGVPRAIGWCLLGLAGWTVAAGIRGDYEPRPPQQPAPVLWIVAGLGAQLILLKIAGFAIATGLLFAFTARAFGKRQLWFSIPVGIVISLGIYGVFDRLLKLNLPAGPLETLIYGG
ncbi:tripartite tricarboxylate transporter TctB family protein [Paracoccaceae bacterium Fryx2]|nr:tripartite tricarboxylate transporter TctB family protein [Paracoccaceae bacterium Fryx2]